jgi:hypothetical protein
MKIVPEYSVNTVEKSLFPWKFMEIHGKSVIFQSFSRKTVENLQTGYFLEFITTVLFPWIQYNRLTSLNFKLLLSLKQHASRFMLICCENFENVFKSKIIIILYWIKKVKLTRCKRHFKTKYSITPLWFKQQLIGS